LHDEVYDLALKWYDIIPSDKKEKIYEIYGEIPEKDANIELCGKYLLLKIFNFKINIQEIN